MQIGLSLSLVGRLLGGASPLALFALGEPGVWFDPSDLTTLYQDTAGTTPVTTPGQTVALMLDKSGRGNHATQATAASRPTYGIVPKTGRRNLLTYTEQFDNATWNKTLSGTGSAPVVTPNAAAAPDGTMTADQVVFNTNAGTASTDWSMLGETVTVSAVNHTGSIYVRTLSGTATLVFRNVAAGVFGSISVTDQWQRFERTELGLAGTGNRFEIGIRQGLPGIGTINASATVLIWGAQLELGSTATAYQRVGSQYDVTEAGVQSLSYIAFDGVDDWMVTPTITPGIDKAQVFAGVRKLSDAAVAILAELSTNAGTGNAGSFYVTAPETTGASGDYRFKSSGSIFPSSTSSGALLAPNTSILTGLGDISGDLATLRVNGTQAAQSTADQGTGNYLAYPLYIGRRGGTTLPFNGYLFGLIVRFGANLDAGTITNTETWLNQRTGAY